MKNRQNRGEGEESKKKVRGSLFPSLFVHFSISAPAEHNECCDDEEASHDGRSREGLVFYAPVHNGNEKNCEAGISGIRICKKCVRGRE